MDDAVICPGCGCPQGIQSISYTDSDNFGWAVLGFCVPIVGLILYLVWNNSAPRKAKLAGKGALASVIAGVVFYIIYAIFIAAIIGSSL